MTVPTTWKARLHLINTVQGKRVTDLRVLTWRSRLISLHESRFFLEEAFNACSFSSTAPGRQLGWVQQEERGLLVGCFWSANIVSREDEVCTMEAHHVQGFGGPGCQFYSHQVFTKCHKHKIQRFICLTARIYLLTILLLANMLTIIQIKRIKVLPFKQRYMPII